MAFFGGMKFWWLLIILLHFSNYSYDWLIDNCTSLVACLDSFKRLGIINLSVLTSSAQLEQSRFISQKNGETKKKKRKMRKKNKILKAITQRSGKPLSETLLPSQVLHTHPGSKNEWVTSYDLQESGLSFPPETVYDLSVFLLGNPHVNSSILFRNYHIMHSTTTISTV